MDGEIGLVSNLAPSLILGGRSLYLVRMIRTGCHLNTECLPAELAAAAAIIEYWDLTTMPAVWISVGLVIVVGINALGVGEHVLYNYFVFLMIRIGAYGESEFWFR